MKDFAKVNKVVLYSEDHTSVLSAIKLKSLHYTFSGQIQYFLTCVPKPHK